MDPLLEEIGILAHKLGMSVLTLGVFCLVSIAYSAYIMTGQASETWNRESRLRAMMQAGVTLMSGAITVFGMQELAITLTLLSGLNVTFSAAFNQFSRLQAMIPMAAQFGVVAVLTVVACLPVFGKDDERRTVVNRRVAMLNLLLAIFLVLLTTAIFVVWRVTLARLKG